MLFLANIGFRSAIFVGFFFARISDNFCRPLCPMTFFSHFWTPLDHVTSTIKFVAETSQFVAVGTPLSHLTPIINFQTGNTSFSSIGASFAHSDPLTQFLPVNALNSTFVHTVLQNSCDFHSLLDPPPPMSSVACLDTTTNHFGHFLTISGYPPVKSALQSIFAHFFANCGYPPAINLSPHNLTSFLANSGTPLAKYVF